jgi:hypothetical protein
VAVDDAEFGIGLPGALLGGGEQFVIEDDAVGLELFGLLDEFGRFATAEQVARGGLAHESQFDAHDADAESGDEFFELFHQIDCRLHFTAVEVGANQEGALDDVGFFSDIKHAVKVRRKEGKDRSFLVKESGGWRWAQLEVGDKACERSVCLE